MCRMPACVHRQRRESAYPPRASRNHQHARRDRRTRRWHPQQSRPARLQHSVRIRVPRAPHSPHRGAAKPSLATQPAHRAAHQSPPVGRLPASSTRSRDRYWYWQHSLVPARDQPHCCPRLRDQRPSPLARKFCWRSLPVPDCRAARAPHRS